MYTAFPASVPSPPFAAASPTAYSRRAFTLIELLVVIAILSILGTLVVGTSIRAIEYARRAKCASTLKGLHLANTRHALEAGRYVAAARNLQTAANSERWHGSRGTAAARGSTRTFNGENGPLAPYFPASKGFRVCPSFEPSGNAPNAFEKGAGGYGYNLEGIGSRVYSFGRNHPHAFSKGVRVISISQPSLTVMFTDAAFGQPYGSPTDLIEYSFAEPYRHVTKPGLLGGVTDPSIHFRHLDRANVIWCDGHISAEKMTIEASPAHTALKLGWFGERNNDLFDTR